MAIRLFEPLELRGVALQNRIVVAPMTQFSAKAGVAGDWHLMHLGQLRSRITRTRITCVTPRIVWTWCLRQKIRMIAASTRNGGRMAKTSRRYRASVEADEMI
jgi:hypothetical protein